MSEPAAATRCGYAAIVGAPNAGKSTLLNQLVGSKVAIVTPKVQTTRSRITAIATIGPSQVVFVDTPGIFQPRRRLDRAMVAAAWSGAADADVVVVLIDATRGRDEDSRRILAGLKEAGRPAVLVLNKVDVADRGRLLALAAALNGEMAFAATFMVSALTGDGVDDLRRHLAETMPPGPWLYPEDQLADLSERLLAAEITREKLFLRLNQELPYAATVETETWEDKADGSVRIGQVIYVTRDNHKGIVLGAGGRTVKAIGAAARRELETLLDRQVHLFLYVKVRDWQEDPERYREIGLEFPK